jgi:succinylarginine dihydrolase
MPDDALEVNFDGIVGPTHSYAGLSVGNLASQKYVNQPSNPRAAALQGLAKMKLLADLGIRQAVLPPQERPDIAALRRVGFTGGDAEILSAAASEDPFLLAACGSASAMWAANAATISPSADTRDGRLHITPANLPTQFHRSLETGATSAVLRTIFADESRFAVHQALPAVSYFGDEGAANHMRLASRHGDAGFELFIYGRSATQGAESRFPARQSLQASAAIARLHGVDSRRLQFVQQNPAAIDAGAFHNDVVAVANLNVLLFYASAWKNGGQVASELRQWFEHLGKPFYAIEAAEKEIPLADAISSYLFNSQLVGMQSMTLIAPMEAKECESARQFLDALPTRGTPIRSVRYVDVRQSMQNGGGPACLRLRVVMTPDQIAAVRPRVFLDDDLHRELCDWVSRNYRETLLPADLADPALLDEGRRALDELTQMLHLGSIYPFQRG